MDSAIRTFFSSPRYAVAGASSDPSKYGHKVFAWYLQHNLDVIPLNPRASTISILSAEYPTLESPSKLPKPSDFSLSVITPPAVTKKLLKEAKEAGIQAVWLQPGTFDDEVLKYANKEFKAAIAGDGGVGGEGWCVLVDGEGGLQSAEGDQPRL